MDDILGEPGGRAYRVRSDDLWELAREAYLGGMTGPEVCERFGLGLGALRARAQREGWRRVDQPDPELAVEAGLDQLDADPFLTPADLAALAWQRAKAAVLRGALREALGWRRVHRDYLEMAVADERAQATGEEDPWSVEHYARYTRPRVWRDDPELRGDWYGGRAAADAEAESPREPPPAAEAGPAQSDAVAELDSLDSMDSNFAGASPKPAPTAAARRLRRRMEAWKARQAARGSPAAAADPLTRPAA